MKKALCVLFTLIMILSVNACLADEAGLYGEWYAEELGLVTALTLNTDGSYTVRYITETEPSVTGSWLAKDGFIFLAGNEAGILNPIGDVLRLEPDGLFFFRDKPEFYTPGSPVADAAPGAFDGYWVSGYVEVNGIPVEAALLDDDTDLYIEGCKAALGGGLFGDVIVDMEASDGALTLGDASASVTMQMQEDGFLRLTVSGAEETMVIYMVSSSAGSGEEA